METADNKLRNNEERKDESCDRLAWDDKSFLVTANGGSSANNLRSPGIGE